MEWFPSDWPTGSGGLARSIAINDTGNIVVVGAFGAPQLGPEIGAAYVCSDVVSPGQREPTLLPSVFAPRSWFGWSTAISGAGDVLVAGAPGPSFQWPGRAFVFRFDGRTWREECQAAGSGTVMGLDSLAVPQSGYLNTSKHTMSIAQEPLVLNPTGRDYNHFVKW
jgi:hypothetical protein